MDRPDFDTTTSNNSRFTSQAHSLEDRLKADTVGLVQLSDFRKRRAEALEAAQDGSSSTTRASTPDGGREPIAKPSFKKRKKTIKKGGLSFGDDEPEDQDDIRAATSLRSGTSTVVSHDVSAPGTDSEALSDDVVTTFKKRAFKPSASVTVQPKAMTKSVLLREAQLKDVLKKEYAQIQEAVKATEFMIPFVFHHGKNIPGGICRMKKGDFIWLFLERARKLGADLASRGDHSRRDWARIGVDDLMVVKGDLIIPHHYDFHYFMINHSVSYRGPLFPYSSEPTTGTPQQLLPQKSASAQVTPEPMSNKSANQLQTAAQRRAQTAAQVGPADSELEGYNDEPSLTKVVDRRWYERNKHIYPANTWEEFDPEKDYTSDVRKDAGGNTMFFSR